MLKIDAINVYYGHIHAITDVTLSVGKGEIVTIIGANGAVQLKLLIGKA